MKQVLLAIASALLLCASTGCYHYGGGCQSGDCGGLIGRMTGGHAGGAMHEMRGWRHQQPQIGPAGPPVATYAYPYYTLHGPRDFLVDDPPSLGN